MHTRKLFIVKVIMTVEITLTKHITHVQKVERLLIWFYTDIVMGYVGLKPNYAEPLSQLQVEVKYQTLRELCSYFIAR